MGSLSIGEFMNLTNALSEVKEDDDAASQSTTVLMLQRFAKSIISWNLEDEEGIPVPATLAGVQSQELGFITQILNAWMEAMAAVDPKSQPSANGTGTFPEVSLPMETLSASLPN